MLTPRVYTLANTYSQKGMMKITYTSSPRSLPLRSLLPGLPPAQQRDNTITYISLAHITASFLTSPGAVAPAADHTGEQQTEEQGHASSSCPDYHSCCWN